MSIREAPCNGICKSKITHAIAEKGLTTLADVRTHTKASASCGSCTGLVEKLLMLSLGDSYKPAATLPMCPCTDLGHDEVRWKDGDRETAVIARRLRNGAALRRVPEARRRVSARARAGRPTRRRAHPVGLRRPA